MENVAPGFAGKVFMTMLRDTMKERPLQWISVKDIGFFAAEAFHDPLKWNKKAIGLATDELTFSQLSQVFQGVTGKPIGTTFSLLRFLLKYGVPEMGKMMEWFRDEGYKANLAEIKAANPNSLTLEAWMRQSPFNPSMSS